MNINAKAKKILIDRFKLTQLRVVARSASDEAIPRARSASVLSGDRHLLKTSGYRGIKVVSPRKFIEEFF